MNNYAEIWNVNLSGLYHSPLGYDLPYPKVWNVKTIRSTVEFMPEDSLFVPLCVLSAQVDERDLSSLEKRLLLQIQERSTTRVLESRRLIQPRPAVLIKVAAPFQDLDLREYYIAELLNGGQLAIVFIVRSVVGAAISEHDLLALWWDARVPPIQTARGFRKMAVESLKVAFEFPANWIIQHASDYLIEIRAPARSSQEPNVVLDVKRGGGDRTLRQLEKHTLNFIEEDKLGAKNIEHTEAMLGNCPAEVISYNILNENQQLDHIVILLPDPQLISASVSVTFSGLAQRWEEYEILFEHMKSSFFWLTGEQ